MPTLPMESTKCPRRRSPRSVISALARLRGIAAALLMLLTGRPWIWADSHADKGLIDSVVIVLDASGSMRTPFQDGKDRMTIAKEALKKVIAKVPSETQIGLLVFSASNLTNDWAFPLGPRNDQVLNKAIDQLVPSRGTPLGAYLKQGADRLLEERAKQFGYGTYRLLVVTDGEAQDADLVERFTPEVVSRGIRVDVIGVAMNSRHTLATRVHSYRPANDPKALQQALSEVFAEVASTATDASRTSDFSLLAGLPVDKAAIMIQALSKAENTPIGGRVRQGRPGLTNPAGRPPKP